MMITIHHTTAYPAQILDTQIKAIYSPTIGVSTGHFGSIIHLPDATRTSDQQNITSALDTIGILLVSADTTTLTEGDPDPAISCDDGLIASDSDLGYVVLLDGERYASGTTPVSNGVADLTLVDPIVGEYEVVMYRLAGNYASGSVTIHVNE